MMRTDTARTEAHDKLPLPPYLVGVLNSCQVLQKRGEIITSRALVDLSDEQGRTYTQAHMSVALNLLGKKGLLVQGERLAAPKTGGRGGHVWTLAHQNDAQIEEAARGCELRFEELRRDLHALLVKGGPLTMREATAAMGLARSRLSNDLARKGEAAFAQDGVLVYAQRAGRVRAVVFYVEGQHDDAARAVERWNWGRSAQARGAVQRRQDLAPALARSGELSRGLHKFAAAMENAPPQTAAGWALRQGLSDEMAKDCLAMLSALGLASITGHHRYLSGQTAPLWGRTDKTLPQRTHNPWGRTQEQLRAALLEHGPLGIAQAEAASGAPKNRLWSRLAGMEGIFLAREAKGEIKVGPLLDMRDEQGRRRDDEQRSGYRVVCLEHQQEQAVELVRQMRRRASFKGGLAAQNTLHQHTAAHQRAAHAQPAPHQHTTPPPPLGGIHAYHAKQRQDCARACVQLLEGGPKTFLELAEGLKRAEVRLRGETLQTHLAGGHPDFAALSYRAAGPALAVVHLAGQHEEDAQALLHALAQRAAQAPPKPQPKPKAESKPKAEPAPSKPVPKETRPPAPRPARGTRQDNKNLDRLAARRAEVAQVVKNLLMTFGPMTFTRLIESLGRAGQRVNESRLRDRIAGQEPCMTQAGVRYMARQRAWAVVYLPQQLAQAEALGKHLDKTPLRRRTAAWTPNPWARTTPAPAQITASVTSPAEPASTPGPDTDPDRRRPRLDSASLDPRREPPLVLPGASPLSPVAARAAAERLAKRATIGGLPWTYRPVVGLSGVWEIVESKRQEDHRLMGKDTCERRLQRWAREGCPPRIDGLTPTGFSPDSKEAQP